MKLFVFDFDGTLFQSPVPNIERIGKELYNKLVTDVEYGGYGWFKNILTLSPEYTENIGLSFYTDISFLVKKYKKYDNSKVILLSGRDILFLNRIKELCNKEKLYFDEYILKQNNYYTNIFKINEINNLIEKYNINELTVYDDKYYIIKKLKKNFENNKNLKSVNLHYVNNRSVYLPEHLENELIQRIIHGK